MAEYLTRARKQQRRRLRTFVNAVLLVGAAGALMSLSGIVRGVIADDEAPAPSAAAVSREMRTLLAQVEAAAGEAAVLRMQLERANAILEYSQRYQIPADLTAAIYDIAMSEGIDPSLGYRLVKVESDFKQGARSHAGAIGYTQIRLATARYYDESITERELHQRDVNLRLGFRFLKDLLERFDNNLNHALLAYNRGPTKVAVILNKGGDPANGYAKAVLRGDPRAQHLPSPVN